MEKKTLYTAIGRFERRKNKCGLSCPVIVIGKQEYMVDMQEMVLWTSLNWRILRKNEMEEVYRELSLKNGSIVERSYQECVDRLLIRGLVVSGSGETEYDALYDLLGSLYIIPSDGNLFLRIFSFCRLTLLESKNMRVLYLLRSGEYMPLQLNLPPTSISPFKEFLQNSFTMRRRATYGSVIQIGLKKMNNGSNDYSVATFRRLYDFSGEQLAQIKAYADGFKEQIKATLQQRVQMNEEQREEGCDYSNMEQLPVANGENFCIGTEIDGEREALPA